MSEWIPVKDRLPNPFHTVLVQHVDDLYPVSAYRFPEKDIISSESSWVYESDGAEDDEKQPMHRHCSLVRDPTHWMPLPKPPNDQ